MMATEIELYNPTLKEAYLKDKFDNEDSKKLNEYLFRKSKTTEEYFGRDLATFNLDQIEMVFRDMNPATRNSASNIKSRITKYIDWAIQNGHRQTNINPLKGTVKWEAQFVDNITERHLSKDKFDEIVDRVPNYQDKALMYSIFEGANGQALSELVNLKYDDLNFDENKITLRDDKGNVRELEISHTCMSYLDKAYHEGIHVNLDSGSELTLMEYDNHIFKNTLARNTQSSKLNKSTLPKRLQRIKEYFELDEFSTNSISESGQISFAVDLYKKYGKLDKEEFDIISRRFRTSRIKGDKYDYANTYKMKQYISRDNIQELYNIDIETL